MGPRHAVLVLACDSQTRCSSRDLLRHHALEITCATDLGSAIRALDQARFELVLICGEVPFADRRALISRVQEQPAVMLAQLLGGQLVIGTDAAFRIAEMQHPSALPAALISAIRKRKKACPTSWP